MSENQSTFRRSKHDKENPYVMISRTMLHDKSISPSAKGLLAYLLSLPNDWQIYHSHLQNALGIGEHSLNSIMAELISAGYAKRTREKVKGSFQPYDYEISENKIFLPDGIFRPGSSGPENPDILKNEYPTDTKKEETKESSSSSFSDQEMQMQNTLLKAGLNESSIKTILSLKPTPEALQTALACSEQYKPDDLGSYLCRAIQNKWQPSKAIIPEPEKQKQDHQAKEDLINANRVSFLHIRTFRWDIAKSLGIYLEDRINFCSIGDDKIKYDNVKFKELLNECLMKHKIIK